MDHVDSLEFIDLSDVEEKEKKWILKSLHTWDPSVIVPWKKVYHTPVKNTVYSVPLHHVPNNYQSHTNCNGSPNISTHNTGNINHLQQPQMCPMYSVAPTYIQHINSVPTNSGLLYQKPIICVFPESYSPTICVDNVTSSVNNMKFCNNSATHEISINSCNTETKPIQHIFNGAPVDVESPDIGNPEVIVENSHRTPSQELAQQDTENKHVELGNINCEVAEKVTIEENVPKSANKSWASLFNKVDVEQKENDMEAANKQTTNISPFVQSTDSTVNIVSKTDKADRESIYNDPVYHILGEYLSEHNIDHRTISLQPRGLINRSNYCYINSILQVLLACPPVYNLLSGLSKKVTTNEMRKLIPVIDNMSKFVKEFQHLPAAQRVSRRSVDKNQKQDPNSLINCDTPFEPSYIYKMLNGMRSDTFVVEGRQEDAEEFLGCLLNGLNDEMLELMKLVGKQKKKFITEIVNVESEIDKEWQVMGPKNKGCVTRRAEVIQTPISDIFNGHLRSRVHRTGDKSTDNIQPFFTLQLNIEKVSTVREALEALVCKNQLEGVTSSRTNKEVEAWQQVTIEELPYILVLHLKCFDYKLDGCTKIIKVLEFPIDLKIDSKLLSSKTNYSTKEKQYKLFAIVYHDGKEASKGHYVTDAYHVGYGRWIRYDDASVKAVPEEQVLKPHGTRVPYLLFYRRSDSIRSK